MGLKKKKDITTNRQVGDEKKSQRNIIQRESLHYLCSCRGIYQNTIYSFLNHWTKIRRLKDDYSMTSFIVRFQLWLNHHKMSKLS